MGVNLHLRRSTGSLQDSRSCSRSIARVLLLKYFHFRSIVLDPLLLRIAMMAQAVFPCNLLLRCRVLVIDDLFYPLLTEMSCGPYGCTQACP